MGHCTCSPMVAVMLVKRVELISSFFHFFLYTFQNIIFRCIMIILSWQNDTEYCYHKQQRLSEYFWYHTDISYFAKKSTNAMQSCGINFHHVRKLLFAQPPPCHVYPGGGYYIPVQPCCHFHQKKRMKMCVPTPNTPALKIHFYASYPMTYL